MRKIALLMVLVALGASALAQADTAGRKFRFDFHGFVNPHFYADSRQVVGGREEMMLFYPKPANWVSQATGNAAQPVESIDANEGWNANLLSITARLGLGVKGPDMLGAQTRAYIEGDFTGSTNASNNDLRLRHAYIDLNWGHHELLAGQYWYPMVVQEIMPNTRPLNMGAPFHPYARYNQLRYTLRINDPRARQTGSATWEAIVVAMYQQDNMSQGVLNGGITSSTSFQRRGLAPEMYLQLRYNGRHMLAGVAANMLTLQPTIYTAATNDTLLQRPRFTTFSYSLFGQYRWNRWKLSMQTLLNNSLYEGCSLGGYIRMADLAMAQYDYRSWHFNTVWADFGKTAGQWRPGLFVGYARNHIMDRYDSFTDVLIMGRGANIEYLWRVQPRLGYHFSQIFNIYAEAEYTFAQYYTTTTLPDGSWAYQHDPNGGIGNLRLMLSAEYRF